MQTSKRRAFSFLCCVLDVSWEGSYSLKERKDNYNVMELVMNKVGLFKFSLTLGGFFRLDG